MICKTAYYNSGGGTYSALAQETAFRYYEIQHQFNRPADCVVTLGDPAGAIMQKYDVDTNAVYAGSGKIMIQDPAPSPDDDTSNIVFYGLIKKAQHNTGNHTVVLFCQDMMSQLALERIHYDFREDLDGSGLRQSELEPDPDSLLYVAPTWKDGADYHVFDNAMDWDSDEWAGYKLVLTAGHAGDITVNTGAYAYTLIEEGGGGATDDENRENTWVGDGNTHKVNWDADLYFGLRYFFRLNATEGSLYNSVITGARVIIEAFVENAGTNDYTGRNEATVYIRDAVFYWHGLPDDDEGQGTIKQYTVEIPEDHLSTLIPLTNDVGAVTITVFGTSGGTGSVLEVDSIKMEYDIETIGTSSIIPITKTFKTCAAIATAKLYEEGVGYIDDTVDINDDGAGDVDLLPDPCSQEDAFYFGFSEATNGLRITTSQAGVMDGTLRWEYYDGDSWEALSSVIDDTSGFEAAAGTYLVTWSLPSDMSQVAVDGNTKYWVRARMITAVPNLTVQPKATQGWGFTGTGNRLQVTTDVSISGLGLWDGCPYSIIQPIYTHLNALITDTTYGCPLVTLTSSIESTSGYTTRHYTDRTRLEILQDASKMDKAVFLVNLNDPTPTVRWKSTFNDGAPTALTDASVRSWDDGEYDFFVMFNEYHVSGIRIGDSKIYVASEDLAVDVGDDSQAKYGVNKTAVISNSGTMSEYEAEELSKALVERDEDVNLFLNATLGGLSSLRLGDEVSITSTMLGLTAEKYVITHWAYSSQQYRTHIRLHPRTASTIGFVDRVIFGDHIRGMLESNREQSSDREFSDLTTQEWS